MDNKAFVKGKSILITGGTGTVAYGLIKELAKYKPKVIRLLANDEDGMFRFKEHFKDRTDLRFLIGDVRDGKRLRKSMEGIDIVFHTAAMKHVWLCEYNPREAIQTNINGILNLIDASLEQDVGTVIFTSSDKAVNPSNVMGTTKLLGEKLITSANFAKGRAKTKFASVRFGNILASRGSVVPIFEKQISVGEPVTITDRKMTRFFLTLEDSVELILEAATIAVGGETFILKMDVIKIGDLYEAMVEDQVPKAERSKVPRPKIIGKQPGEKLYEELMTVEEIPRTRILKNMFVILPELYDIYQADLDYTKYLRCKRTKKVYRSDSQRSMGRNRLKMLLKDLKAMEF